MLARTGALAAVLLMAPMSALALAPRGASVDDWTISPGAGVSAAVRVAPTYDWNVPLRPAAWRRFTAAFPGRWFASWDHATAMPTRIYGEGVLVPGSVADAAIAEQFARAFLADHLDLLAPGASASDFELASNTSDGEIRSIGFFQRKNGLRVVGGQIAFELKRDRLIVIHGEAFPDVQPPAFALLAPGPLAERARVETIAATGVPGATATAAAAPVILPLVADDRVLGYRAVVPVDVDAGAHGRWTVYADAASGATVARHDERRYSTGTVQYDAVVRWTGRPRALYPAQRMHAQVDGAPATTDDSGNVTWSAAAPVALVAGSEGDLVKVQNATQATQSFQTTIAPNGAVTWSEAANADLDAEVNAFVHVQIAKAYVRTFDPTLAWLDEQIVANVDLQQTCNAFYAGGTLNFFHEGNGCANTGTIADVVYHEFEHGVHEHEVIPGVGQIDGSMGEGQSDFIAASITGDSGMGRGFNLDDSPLRELDPVGQEARWPDNVGEIHHQGLIFAGAMWDLRKALIAQYGEAKGVPLVNKLFLGAIRRSSTIPSTLVEILAADDDNGNLADGTPNECAILTAFGAHGLRAWSAETTQAGSVVASPGQTTIGIDVALNGLSTRCTSDTITSIKMRWDPSSGSTPIAGSVDMTAGADPAHWHAELPLPDAGGIVSYQIDLKFADGSDMWLPDNNVDPYYKMYQGPTVPLYCADFESDPFAAGWKHKAVFGHDDWTWAAPVASASGDPGAAFTGTHVVGTTIGGDGTYSPMTLQQLILPTIDLGKYSDVHLQYRRHLAVQDGQNDQATIYANGEIAWQNPAQAMNSGRQYHYVDKEWIFDDVPLSGHIAFGSKLTVTFELNSDGGYQLGGWNLDDVCVVANANAFCGDGIKQGTEQCDNGAANADVADTCRTYCRLPACGDGILDSKEQCDDGNKADGDGCSSKCVLEPKPPPGGCCEAGGGSGAGAVGLSGLVGLLLVGRRRRRRR
jgi:cysteine-rich repeat protein